MCDFAANLLPDTSAHVVNDVDQFGLQSQIKRTIINTCVEIRRNH